METKKGFPSDTGGVFYVLGFIEYHVLPFYTLKVLLVLDNLKKKMKSMSRRQVARTSW
jgi:hypothetical protein